MCRLLHAGRAAGIAEHIAEGLLRERFAVHAADEGKITRRAIIKSFAELRQYWQVYFNASFLGAYRRYSIAYMLASDTHGITTTETGVEQHCNPYPLTCTKWPLPLICGDLFVGPRGKSFAGLYVWVLNRSEER